MKKDLEKIIEQALQQLNTSGKCWIPLPATIQIEKTRDATHGHFSTNIAMVLSKQVGLNPRELAEMIIEEISASKDLAKVEIAGPGFINFFLKDAFQHTVVAEILNAKDQFGRCDFGKGKRVHIEYVSSNPTGPLHVGHGRGAAFGAAAANLLEAVGYQVHREYYVNDAGRQMDILTVSIWLRYLEACGEEFKFPSSGYKGNYIRELAVDLKSKYGDRFHRIDEDIFNGVPHDAISNDQEDGKEAHINGLICRAKALLVDDYELIFSIGAAKILEEIKEDLAEFGVIFQEWFSEKSLFESGAIEKGIQALKDRGTIYEKDNAVWFKSTQFGDEKDRVLIRENGQSTYFASDVAYHWNKLQRGFDILIDVLGADHHGYVPRVRAAIQALGLDPDALKVPLVQFAILYRKGKKIQMSTRGGEFVTLRELREEVGNDAARFFYVMRKVDQHMDFDLDLAKSQSNDNPVYYIQYAHARICSVFRQLEEKGLKFNEKLGLNELNKLTSAHEAALLSHLSYYPEVILTSTKNLEPHQLANYLRELAHEFHTYYNAEHFIVENEKLRQARLCLIEATRQVIKNGLNLLGVNSPEKM